MKIIIFLLLSFNAHAFRLSPMVLELKPWAKGSSGTFSVENGNKEKVAIQFEMRRRIVNLDGQEDRPPAEGFIVYPEQLTLNPGEKRNIRITWTGEQNPEKELPFRLVASQLPVQFAEKKNENGGKLNFLLEYVASVYIVPEKGTAKVRLEKISINSKNEAEFVLSNEGKMHQLFNDFQVTFKNGEKTYAPDSETLKEIKSENILAGNKRIFRVPLPKDFGKSVQADVKF